MQLTDNRDMQVTDPDERRQADWHARGGAAGAAAAIKRGVGEVFPTAADASEMQRFFSSERAAERCKMGPLPFDFDAVVSDLVTFTVDMIFAHEKIKTGKIADARREKEAIAATFEEKKEQAQRAVEDTEKALLLALGRAVLDDPTKDLRVKSSAAAAKIARVSDINTRAIQVASNDATTAQTAVDDKLASWLEKNWWTLAPLGTAGQTAGRRSSSGRGAAKRDREA